MSNVSAEEAQAIADELAPRAGAARPAVVAPRDFSAPQRLGAERQATLRKALKKSLSGVNRALSAWLRRPIELELESVGELDAATLFADLKAPFCVLSFATAPAGGAATQDAGWLVWELSAATIAAELALGGNLPKAPRENPLSDVERSIVAEVLADVAAPLAGALRTDVRAPRLLQDEDELPLLAEEAEAGDTRRLSAHLTVRGLGEDESTLRLYLPDHEPSEAGAETAAVRALPGHLGPVPVELGAELGSLEIELADLLALEVGDVLALGVEAGAPVTLRVEGQTCGTAELGQRSGNLALRIQELRAFADLDT